MTGMLTEFSFKPITPGQWLWIDCPGPLDGAVGLVDDGMHRGTFVPNHNRVDLIVPTAVGDWEASVMVVALASLLISGPGGGIKKIRLHETGLPDWRPPDANGSLMAKGVEAALRENQDASRWLASGATRPLSRLDDDRAVKIELDGVMRLREFRRNGKNMIWELVGEIVT